MLELISDKTGFPLAVVPGVGAFHLWPVTKFQFEQFVSEPNRYGDQWYESIHSLNERISYRNFSNTDYERLFMTGILPTEAIAFARWLGKDFDLPTEAEWEKFYSAVSNLAVNFPLSLDDLSLPAVTLFRKLDEFLNTPLKFSFLQEGVVEWVRGENGYVGRGAPRDSFFSNAWDPQADSIRLINSKDEEDEERIFFFGFRLIKRNPTAWRPS